MTSCLCPTHRSSSLQARLSLAGLLCSTGLLHFPQHHSHTVLPVWLHGSAAGCVLVSALAQKHAGVHPLDALSDPVFFYWRRLLRRCLEEGVGNTAERVLWKGTWGFKSEPTYNNFSGATHMSGIKTTCSAGQLAQIFMCLSVLVFLCRCCRWQRRPLFRR